ncbi:hypothetical protein O181_122292 [Austropuccinia psidii MF-1]|uniref:Uncharacterized protein n=1 Tax=Austropuccinia psidii MF-1 TaxID=1389203 RepID=A0A9Q3Q489_9BASI|nr:hypothetical protein [Austropuccinia psidii MF-1]
MNSYPTVGKSLGHPNTCKLLNGWNPLMEKKNMILLEEEWSRNNPPPPKKVPKTGPVAIRSNYNIKKQPQDQNKGKGKVPATNHTARATGFHGKCVSEGQNHDGITEKGGSQIKISQIISEILDEIPNLYIAINDIKIHISDKN